MSKLFNEFDKVSPEAWKQKIQVDLKGADSNETLLSATDEGIVIKPFYSKEDSVYHNINFPSEGFLICQSVFVDDEIVANKIARDVLKRGANAIQFKASSKFDFEKLLNGIDIESTTFYFQFTFLSKQFISELSQFISSDKVFYQIDIYGNLERTGNWFENKEKDSQVFSNIINITQNSICIDATLYQNAGANKVQELAYALTKTNEYIEQFGADIISKLHFMFSVGGNYFFEISKLRAFRVLLDTLLRKHGIENHVAHVFCIPSMRNKTLYDYNVNILRTTTESMSAILGGATTVSNLTYDAIFHKSNEFGERISRNQLLILQQESYLSNAYELANGTYFIESITHQLAEKALQVFKQIEKGGGHLIQLKKGIIQSKIKESANKEQLKFSKKELVLLGSNRLPNEADKMKDNLDLYPFVKKNNIKTIIPPIIEKRLAEEEEQERLKQE